MAEEPEAVEITIVAKDARGNTARQDFEYTPKAAGVTEAVDDLRRGFVGSIDERIKPVNQSE